MIKKYEPKAPKKTKNRIINILLSVLAAGMWFSKDFFSISYETLIFVTVLLFGTLFFSFRNNKMAEENYETAKALKEMRDKAKTDDL